MTHQNQMTIPEKQIPILCDADVVVAGGGTAGFAAAVSAARADARVVIVEKSNLFGGLWTNGLVLRLYGTHAFLQGERKNYFGGVGKEVIDRLRDFHHGVRFFGENDFEPTPDPEAAIHVMDQMVREEKITVLFNTYISGAVQEGNTVTALICDSKQGQFALPARCFVDATGDCDILHAVSEECVLVTRYNMGLNHILTGIRDIPEDVFCSVYSNTAFMANPDTYWINMSGCKCDWTDLFAMSQLEMTHRDTMWKQLEQLRKVAASDAPYISKSATQMGTRVTRLPQNDRTLSYACTEKQPHFSEPIGVSGWANYERNYKNQVPPYQIPYDVIRPESISNLWVAGRCVNADEVAADSLRLIPNCFITGQAAGAAAALCAANGWQNDTLPYGQLEQLLRQQNVILDY